MAKKDLDIPGEVTAKAELNGTVEQLALENLSAVWTGPDQSSVELTGHIGNIAEIKDIALRLAGELGKAAWLTPLLPETIGPLNTAELSARISGNQSQLKLRDCNLKATTENELDLSLAGQFDLANVVSAPEPENIDVKLIFAAPTTRAARALLFDTIPEFGAIKVSTEIRSTRKYPQGPFQPVRRWSV
jgi:hypothetical protein